MHKERTHSLLTIDLALYVIVYSSVVNDNMDDYYETHISELNIGTKINHR